MTHEEKTYRVIRRFPDRHETEGVTGTEVVIMTNLTYAEARKHCTSSAKANSAEALALTAEMGRWYDYCVLDLT